MAILTGGPERKLLGAALLEGDKEQEHIWRELLQKQLGEHWLNLYCPEQTKKQPILPKIRGDKGKAA
jgi:hypothetical protein